MPKAPAVEESLTQLKTLRTMAPSSPEFRQALTKALGGKINLLAARAATYVGELRLADFVPALAEAFKRFMHEAEKTDKGCPAKTAIAKALVDMEVGADADAVYLAGVRHVQREPVWGGSEDSAGELRGYCVLGLALMNHRGVMAEIVDLLVDPHPAARTAAARAVAVTGREEGAWLLRLKLLTGDRSPDALAEAMTALVRLTPRNALPFLARFLDSHDEATRESAALAIGSSRQPAGFELLRQAWDHALGVDARRPLLLALAMLRLEESLAFLLSVVESEDDSQLAADAVDALRLYRHDEAVRAKVKAAAEKRADAAARRAFAWAFGDAT
jgi:HEAT repeat protein